MTNQDYLIHYGVLGMKWGVRKDRGSNRVLSKRKQAKSKRAKAALIERSRRGIESENRDASETKAQLSQLKKEGVKSKRILDIYKSFDDAEYLKLIGGKKGILKEEISRLERNHENCIDRGKAFTKSLLAVEKTDPSKQTAKEIYRVNNEAWNKSINESVNSRLNRRR